MLFFLLAESSRHATGEAPSVGVALLTVGPGRVAGVPLDVGLDGGHHAVVGVEENPLCNLEVLFQPHQANPVRLAASAPVPVGPAAVVLRDDSGEGDGPGVRHSGASDVQDLPDDFHLVGLNDLFRPELVLSHEFAGLEQRGLGLVLIRAFCQGQQLSDFVLDVGCHLVSSFRTWPPLHRRFTASWCCSP